MRPNTINVTMPKKALIGYFDPSVSKQLKQLALDEDSTVQQLLGEALDLLFQARGKPPNREREHLLWKLRRGPGRRRGADP